MPDGGDHGHGACAHRAHDRLLVEGPQVLHGPAAAPDDHRVHRLRAQGLHGLRDGGRRALALHAAGAEQDVHGRVAAVRHAHDVPDHRAGGRGRNADAARRARQGALLLGIEEALGLQAGAVALKAQPELAHAVALHALAVELILALRLVQGDIAGQQHAHAVPGDKGEPHGVLPEHHAAHEAALVLQGEVEVAGDVALKAGDLPAHAQAAQQRVRLQEGAHIAVELADAQGQAVTLRHVPRPPRRFP